MGAALSIDALDEEKERRRVDELIRDSGPIVGLAHELHRQSSVRHLPRRTYVKDGAGMFAGQPQRDGQRTPWASNPRKLHFVAHFREIGGCRPRASYGGAKQSSLLQEHLLESSAGLLCEALVGLRAH
jgi:hypothetical protein